MSISINAILEKKIYALATLMDLDSTALCEKVLQAYLDKVTLPTFAKAYNVVLTGLDGDRLIPAIKAVRAVTGFDLKTAKDVVDSLKAGKHVRILSNVTEQQSNEVASLFNENGVQLFIDPVK